MEGTNPLCKSDVTIAKRREAVAAFGNGRLSKYPKAMLTQRALAYTNFLETLPEQGSHGDSPTKGHCEEKPSQNSHRLYANNEWIYEPVL